MFSGFGKDSTEAHISGPGYQKQVGGERDETSDSYLLSSQCQCMKSGTDPMGEIDGTSQPSRTCDAGTFCNAGETDQNNMCSKKNCPTNPHVGFEGYKNIYGELNWASQCRCGNLNCYIGYRCNLEKQKCYYPTCPAGQNTNGVDSTYLGGPFDTNNDTMSYCSCWKNALEDGTIPEPISCRPGSYCTVTGECRTTECPGTDGKHVFPGYAFKIIGYGSSECQCADELCKKGEACLSSSSKGNRCVRACATSGTELDDTTLECTDCSPGKYRESSMSKCMLCPEGTVSRREVPTGASETSCPLLNPNCKDKDETKGTRCVAKKEIPSSSSTSTSNKNKDEDGDQKTPAGNSASSPKVDVGLIVGISVGSVVLLCCFFGAVFAFFILQNKNKKKKDKSIDGEDDQAVLAQQVAVVGARHSSEPSAPTIELFNMKGSVSEVNPLAGV
jgi:hypothetical protein